MSEKMATAMLLDRGEGIFFLFSGSVFARGCGSENHGMTDRRSEVRALWSPGPQSRSKVNLIKRMSRVAQLIELARIVSFDILLELLLLLEAIAEAIHHFVDH